MIMHQASTILRNTRLDKDLTVEEVSKKTKISRKYIQALEEGDAQGYPAEPYVSLFVRDYAHFLGLNSNEVLSIFRRDYYQNRKSHTPRKLPFGFTPQFTFTVGVVAVIIIFSLYLFSEYLKFNRPPELRVNWPPATLTMGSEVELSGVTDPESTVRINQDLVVVDNQGKFTKRLSINNPEFKIIIESKAPSGKSTMAQKVLTASE